MTFGSLDSLVLWFQLIVRFSRHAKEVGLDENPKLMTVSQAAARLGVHPDTLRAWADKGLVGVVRTPTGYRRFEPEEIDRVREEMGLEGKPVA